MTALAPTPRLALRRESQRLFHWNARHGGLTAATGQVPSHLVVAAGTLIDAAGVSCTTRANQPAWRMVDLDADGVREARVLHCVANDTVAWDLPLYSATMSGLLEIVHPSSAPAATTGLWYLGRDDQTGARLWIDWTGTVYRISYYNGTSTVTATMGSAPAASAHTLLRWQLQAGATLKLWQSIGPEGTEVASGAGGTVTLAAAFGSPAKSRLNRLGTGGGSPAGVGYLSCHVDVGLVARTELLRY